MLISQKEDYFENCLYRLLDEPLLFPLALKRNLYKKGFSSDKTKKNLIFYRKTFWKEQSFIFTAYLLNYIFQTSVLFNTW